MLFWPGQMFSHLAEKNLLWRSQTFSLLWPSQIFFNFRGKIVSYLSEPEVFPKKEKPPLEYQMVRPQMKNKRPIIPVYNLKIMFALEHSHEEKNKPARTFLYLYVYDDLLVYKSSHLTRQIIYISVFCYRRCVQSKLFTIAQVPKYSAFKACTWTPLH